MAIVLKLNYVEPPPPVVVEEVIEAAPEASKLSKDTKGKGKGKK